MYWAWSSNLQKCQKNWKKSSKIPKKCYWIVPFANIKSSECYCAFSLCSPIRCFHTFIELFPIFEIFAPFSPCSCESFRIFHTLSKNMSPFYLLFHMFIYSRRSPFYCKNLEKIKIDKLEKLNEAKLFWIWRAPCFHRASRTASFLEGDF